MPLHNSHDGQAPPLTKPPNPNTPEYDRELGIERTRRFELIRNKTWAGMMRQSKADFEYDELNLGG